MADKFMETLQRQEELHPDLKPWVEKSRWGETLRHPLIYGLFYHPGMNALLNEQYKAKREYSEKALAKGDYSQYIWLHERPYRMEKFIDIADDLPDAEYWSLLGSIWSDSENLWQYGRSLGGLLEDMRPGRENMMDEEEKKFLASLPDQLVVYRGHQIRNRLGYSWTLSYWRAKWFAERFDPKRKGIVCGTVCKQDIVAVLLGRNEFEIVCHPDNLTNIKSLPQKKQRPEWIAAVHTEAVESHEIARHTKAFSSVHGPWHWEKVESNAAALAKRTPGADAMVAQLFSLVHDCKRVNDDDDPEHGHRAADFCKALYAEGKLKIDDKQLGILMEACKFHNDGQVSSDPTIGVCWDADRLDLTRVGIIPDPNLLSTQAGRDLLWKV